MTGMTVVSRGGDYLERPRSSGLADVIDIILDKGLVIDAFVRVSVLGLELITIDARIVVASVDTYLRFAEAVDRVVLGSASGKTLTDVVGGAVEGGARRKTRGVAAGAKETAKEALGIEGNSEEEGDRDRDGGGQARQRPGGGE